MNRPFCTLVALVACGGGVATSEPEAVPPGSEPAASAPPVTDPSDELPGDADDEPGAASSWEITSSGWAVTTLASTDRRGELAVLVDARDQPHVAYTSDATASLSPSGHAVLSHAWLVGDRVMTELVDAGTSGSVKSWVRGSGAPRLLYGEAGYGTLGKQALLREDGRWEVESGQYAERSGAMTAAWRDGRLLLARLTSTPEVLPNGGGTILQLGLDVDGQALPAEQLRLADEDTLPLLAMAVDGSGRALVAYSTQLEQLDGSWVSDRVAMARAGVTGSAPVDGAEAEPVARAALSELPRTVIRFITQRPGEMSVPEDITSEPTWNTGLSVEVGADDSAHIVFAERRTAVDEHYEQVVSYGINHFSRSAAGSWSRDEVLPGSASALVARGALAVDARGDLHLAYCRMNADGSRCNGAGYARRSDGQWRSEEIQSGDDGLGNDAALALGADGAVYVAYRAGGELRLARKTVSAP